MGRLHKSICLHFSCTRALFPVDGCGRYSSRDRVISVVQHNDLLLPCPTFLHMFRLSVSKIQSRRLHRNLEKQCHQKGNRSRHTLFCIFICNVASENGVFQLGERSDRRPRRYAFSAPDIAILVSIYPIFHISCNAHGEDFDGHDNSAWNCNSWKSPPNHRGGGTTYYKSMRYQTSLQT